MSVTHRVTGYDQLTERLERSVSLSSGLERDLLAKIEFDDGDREGHLVYPLSETMAQDIVRVLGIPLHVDSFDWFLEPAAADQPFSG